MSDQTLQVLLQPEKFARTNSGAITGPIWLKQNGVDYPTAGWSDFPVVILGWWLENLANMSSGTTSATCRFMDGPFQFSLTKARENSLNLQFNDGTTDKPSTISLLQLHAAFHLAAVTALNECDRRGWNDRDIETLRELVPAISH